MGNIELSLIEEQLGKLRLDLEKINVNRAKIQETINQLESQSEQVSTQRTAIQGAIQVCETMLGEFKKSQELAKIAEEEKEAGGDEDEKS